MLHCMFRSVYSCTHSSTPCAHDVVAECALVTVLRRRTVKVCMYVCVCVYICITSCCLSVTIITLCLLGVFFCYVHWVSGRLIPVVCRCWLFRLPGLLARLLRRKRFEDGVCLLGYSGQTEFKLCLGLYHACTKKTGGFKKSLLFARK